jgi:hypothetical protein
MFIECAGINERAYQYPAPEVLADRGAPAAHGAASWHRAPAKVEGVI